MKQIFKKLVLLLMLVSGMTFSLRQGALQLTASPLYGCWNEPYYNNGNVPDPNNTSPPCGQTPTTTGNGGGGGNANYGISGSNAGYSDGYRGGDGVYMFFIYIYFELDNNPDGPKIEEPRYYSSTPDCGDYGDNNPPDNNQPIDCAGVIGGSAYVDSCRTCVGGTTGLQPCSPKKVDENANCPPSAAQNAATINSILNANSIIQQNMNTLSANAASQPTEWSMSIDKNGTGYKMYADGNGTVLFTKNQTTKADLHYGANTVAAAHSHPCGANNKNIPCLSVQDVQATIDVYKSNGCFRTFVATACDGAQYAVYVDCPAAALAFSSAMGQFADATTGLFDGLSPMYKLYVNCRKQLGWEGYSGNDAVNYAIIATFALSDSGLKFYKKVPGSNDFKEQTTPFSFGPITTYYPNSAYGVIFKPTKCQ